MAISQPVLIVVCGPTASGKTDFAIQLAHHFNTEILSADSRQIYREISIGTAKPTAEKLAEIPHHFIGHCSVKDTYNAGIYEKEALALLNKLFKQHKVVIAAGGTGLYIKALCEGLDDLPAANKNLRKQMQKQLDDSGVDYLFEKLKKLDKEGSKTIDPKNPHRIMRAIELVLETGSSIIDLKTNPKILRPFKIIKLIMDVDRISLYQRINSRVDEMLKEGLLEEVKSVYHLKHLNSLKTVGYSELFDFLDGKLSLPEAIEKMKQHTRNYAKRQMTWFRNETGLIPHHQVVFDNKTLNSLLNKMNG